MVATPLLLVAFTFTFPSSWAALQPLRESLRSELTAQSRTSDFSQLQTRWEKSYGTRAAPELLSLAREKALPDSSRYIALVSAARLGRGAIAGDLVPFLKDPSWMIRSGALLSLGALRGSLNPATALEAVRPMLYDKSSLVRAEAARTVRLLTSSTKSSETAKTPAPRIPPSSH